MQIEIWSDVVCPWCYIGKRRLEQALSTFEHSKYIQIEWKSYQLDPSTETDPSKDAIQVLADKKGMSYEQALAMGNQVAAVAKTVGLDYHFEKTIPVNTLKAHRFLHLAKAKDKQAEAKEILLNAYFTLGLNFDENQILTNLGQEIGIDTEQVQQMLNSTEFIEEVYSDIKEGQLLGLRGVPYFVFNRKYGISGAQEVDIFIQTLRKSFDEWLPKHHLEI